MITLKNWLRNSKERPETRSAEAGVDVILLLTVIALVLFGLIMVYSASFIFAREKTGDGFSFIRRQLIYAALGFGGLWIALKIEYTRWKEWAYPGLLVALLFLAMILVPGVGERVGGARRWLHFGALRFQPAEFAKFAVIVFVARQLDLKREHFNRITAGVFSLFVAPLPVLLLLLLQPDFGTTVMISLVIFSMMFLAGVPARYLLGSVALAAVGGGMLALGSGYRRNRLLAYMDPWQDPAGKGFQIIQSFVGIHNGGVWGVGLGNGKEKLFFLPEAHNDFIFSVIGEELGFIGIASIILVYVFFVYRGLKIAWTSYAKNDDRFGMLLATGITLALGFQSFVNVGVVLGLLPTKGLTLPFISYGGSALVVDLFAVGVLLNISRNSRNSLDVREASRA